MKKDSFSGYHPVNQFVYFTLVLLCAMFFVHPICLVLSIVCGFGYHTYLNGLRASRRTVCFLLPMVLLAALVNPAFNHQGATILTYLPTGNPLTLESITYGIGAAGMLTAVILWFACYNTVMTTDKFVYLFGRIIPALSLVLSMTLRFIPKFKAQLAVVRQAQKCVGRDTANGTLLQRTHHAVTILSIMVTWALENAIETADSMKSRGYGLAGRTAFSIYRWEERDKNMLLWLIFCGIYIFSGAQSGGLFWRYYPTMKGAAITPFSISFVLVYAALCLTPVMLGAYADRMWKNREESPCSKA